MNKVREYKWTEIEEWYDIENYEGSYQLSNHLRVRSLDRIIKYIDGRIYKQKGRVLKPGTNGTTHLFVVLNKNNISKTIGLHRLIAAMFLDNSNNLPIVEHIDDNPLNNHPNNLMWSNASNNGINANYRSNKQNIIKSILQYTLSGEFVTEHESISKAQRLFTIANQGRITSCLLNRTKSAYGYLWRYKDEIHQPGKPLVLTEQPRVVALF